MRLVVVIACGLLLCASGAQAKRWFGGVVPDLPGARSPTHVEAGPLARDANLPYGGGPVLHFNRTHAIFWQPAGSGLSYSAGYMSLVDRFLADVAADSHKTTNPYGLSGQYTDSSGPAAYSSAFAGSVLATDPLPPSGCSEPPPPPLGSGPGWSVCMNDDQLGTELEHVVSAHRLPRTQHDIYLLVTPSGLGSCEFSGPDECALGGDEPGSYCGYHSSSSHGLLYAVIPYNAVAGHCQSTNPRPNSDPADPTISTISHEHNEIVTDPLGDAWIDEAFEEDGDLCISSFGPAIGGAGSEAWNEVIHSHHYYLQEEWSNANGACEPRAESDRLSISVPAGTHAGAKLSLAARGRAPQARIISFSWWFGDGKTGHGRRPAHVFQRSGSFRVVVRGTDSWDNWVFSARTLRIAGPAARDQHRHKHQRRSVAVS